MVVQCTSAEELTGPMTFSELLLLKNVTEKIFAAQPLKASPPPKKRTVDVTSLNLRYGNEFLQPKVKANSYGV